MQKELMNIVVVGHVDHGKSTIVGRLLADTHSLPQGKLEQIKTHCERNAKPFEYAFLLDALKDEQTQGITIDLARCFFKTAKRKYLILDAPGHLEFLKNMVTGAAHAEAALLVIDADEGIQENSKRHAYMLAMLGIKQLLVLVNKMDLIHYSQDAFQKIISEYTLFLNQIGLEPMAFIPVSGRQGDNLATSSVQMLWYSERTVLEALDHLEKTKPLIKKDFRMSVQDVYKFTEQQDTRRIIAGKIDSGKIKVGDHVTFYPSGKTSCIKSIEAFHVYPLPQSASAGFSTGFTLTEQIYVKRGDVLVKTEEKKPEIASRIQVSIFWLGKHPIEIGKAYDLKCGTAKVRVRVEKILRVMNAASLENRTADAVQCHEIAYAILKLHTPIAFDLVEDNPLTSRFVLVDQYDIAGGGIIQQALNEELSYKNLPTKNIHWQPYLSRQDGIVVWLTGLSGAGKSSIAKELQKKLQQENCLTYCLDGDNVRHGLNADLGFSDKDRKENIRRIAEVANLFKDAGLLTLVSCISPHEEMRQYAKKCIGSESFIEVYVKAPLEVCQQRDVKGLYRKVQNNEIPNFTGVSSDYEEPTHPDVVVETDLQDIETSVSVIFDFLMKRFSQYQQAFD